ncbi:MAG: hypothetical protein AAF217_00635 [Pseudomonadota bacterium]
MARLIFAFLLILGLQYSALADGLLGKEWINEAEMKNQSAFARQHSLVLVSLNCKFKENVSSPGRKDVLFRAEFEQREAPIGWGWTFDANAPMRGPEQQAKAAGFEVASEDYFEMTGVTWVRCKVWHRPQ